MKNLNKVNLKKLFLAAYINEATEEQLLYINKLLNEGKYEQVYAIIDEYIQNMVNKKDLKNSVSGNPSGEGEISSSGIAEEEFDVSKMDPEAFELYCILMLIDELSKEQDETKKKSLLKQIERAIENYRNSDQTPRKTR